MADSIRQQLVDKLKLRLAAIDSEADELANGYQYQTDLGSGPIEEWPVVEQFEELPALGVFDLVARRQQEAPRLKGIVVEQPFQVRGFLKRGTSPSLARQMLADVMQAVVTDPETGQREPTFAGLAIDTKPESEGFSVPENTFEIDGFAIGFTVEYLAEPFTA